MNQFLQGIRVIDVTNVLSGPYAAYQLALLAADVIKIESPDGDLARQLGAKPELNQNQIGASFLAQNSGKRSITLNLKTEEGKEVFKRLCTNADVLIENFRPGVMKRLGLDYETLKDINPQLIYCSLSGFGQTGPLANSPAYDQIIQGFSGIMSITGTAEAAPLRVGYPICDTLAGITAAYAITAALLNRTRNSHGCYLDVSMLDSSISTLGWVVSNLLLANQEPQPAGNDNTTASPSGTFRTKNGMLNIAANKQEQFVALCHLLGHSEWVTDDRFHDRENRKINRITLSNQIEAVLKTCNTDYWEKKLNQAGIPCGPVLSVADALQHPQIKHRKLLMTLPFKHKLLSEVQVSRSGFHIDGQPTSISKGPPLLGEHTEEILKEIGYNSLEISRLKNSKAI